MPKRIWLNIITLLIAAAVCLGALEFLARLLFPNFNPAGNFIVQADEAGFVLGPKNFSGRQWQNTGDFNVQVSINKYGFRDQHDLARSSGRDIFVAGDSFGFGWGVEAEQRFSNLLEKMLHIKVVNLSVPGGDFWDYDQLLQYAGRHGAHLRKVVIAVCLENDLRDYSTGPTPHATREPHLSLKQKINKFFRLRSTAYNLLAFSIRENSYSNKIATIMGLNQRGEVFSYYPTYDKKVIDSSINKLVRIAKKFDTIILIIPSRWLWVGNHISVADKIHREFVDQLTKSGLKFIDLRPYLETGGSPMQYHFKNDAHWNVRGHRLAAQVMAAYLKEKGWAP
jgi:hypothetical protein